MAEEIVTIGGDSIGLIDALTQVVGAVDDVRLALESLGAGGTSLQDVIAAIQGIGTSAGEASGEMSSLASSADEAAASSEGLSGRMGELGGVMGETLGRATELAGAFLEFQAAFAVIEGVQHFIGDMLGMNEQFQSLTITLKNFVGAKNAADLTGWVQSWATKVPFTTQAVMQAVVAITALGDNAKQVVPMLATLAAQMGVSLPTATQALLDAQNGLWRMMERDLHINRQELVAFGLELDKKGHVLNNSLLPALEKFSQTKFPTALSDKMSSFSGLASEATDLIQLFAKAIGAPLFDAAQQGLGKVVAWAQDSATQQGLQQLGTIAGGALADGFRTFFNIISAVISVIQGGVGWFQQMTGDVKQAVAPVSQLAGASKTASGHMSGFATAAADLKAPLKALEGPLKPVVTLFQDLSGAIQAVIGWFTPTADASKKVTVGMREWVQTGDGVGHWKSKVVTSMMDIPGQASGFQKFLDQLKQAFATAFDDKNGQKAHALALALQDAGTALVDVGTWLAGGGLVLLQGLASVLGGIASAAAGFFQTLQDHHLELAFFLSTMGALTTLLAVKTVNQLGELGVNIWLVGIKAKGAVTERLSVFGEAIGVIRDSAKDAWDWLKNKFSPAVDDLGTKAHDNAGKVKDLSTAEQDVSNNADAQPVKDMATAESDLVNNADATPVSNLATAEGQAVKNADAQPLKDMGTAEQVEGTNAETAYPEVNNLALAEESAATQAGDGAGNLQTFASQEEAVGSSASTATGAAGAAGSGGGGGLGLLGLAAAIGWCYQETGSLGESFGKLLGHLAGADQVMPPVDQLIKKMVDDVAGLNSNVEAGIGLWQQLENIWTGLKPPPLPAYHGGGGGHPHASGGTVGANEPWQTVSEEGLELALLAPGAAKLPTGTRIFTAAQTAPFLPYLEGSPTIGGTPLGAFGGGLLGGGFGGGIPIGALQQAIVNALQQGFRTMQMGAAPTSATTGSIMQQFSGANFTMYGVQNVASLQAELNLLAGLTIEAAMRGAING